RLRVVRVAERVLEAMAGPGRPGEVRGAAEHLVLDLGALERVVTIDHEARDQRAGVVGERRAPVLLVLEPGDIEPEPAAAERGPDRRPARAAVARGAVLPALRAREAAVDA